MLNLEKRECGIKVRLIPSGAMFLKVEIDIEGEHLEFWPSSAMAGQFGDFINSFYALFSENSDNHKEPYSGKCAHEVDGDVIVTTKTQWDEEGSIIDIIFERRFCVDDENWDNSDIIDLTFFIHRQECSEKHFSISTKELCYAIAKACTEILKEYGFYGYRLVTEWDYFKIYQLLYIKAFALDCMEMRSCDNEEGKTNFNDEIELLMFDM